jgi:hypothetical protein
VARAARLLPGFHLVYQATALVYLNLPLLILSIDPPSTAAVYIAVFTAAALTQVVAAPGLNSQLTDGVRRDRARVHLFTRYFEHLWRKMSQGRGQRRKRSR